MKKIIEKIPGYDFAVLPYHKLVAATAAAKHGFPAKNMKVIGVTGTNGKTTTSFMIYRMLKEAGKKVALMTTVAYGIGDDIKPQVEHLTTASSGLLNERMREVADAGAEYLVLEITSHALAQYRAFGVPFDIAVMTNVTHEHLDYHRTFERYRDAKRKLFQLTDKNGKGARTGIVNADDKSAGLFVSDIKTAVTYGQKDGDLKARQVKLLPGGVDYFVKRDGRKLHIRTQIPGDFNVYNSLAAVAVGLEYGLTDGEIENGIFALDYVEGRMNRIDEGQEFDVVMDYAHTPDSFEILFSDMRKTVKGNIIAVFGSAGGRRDPAKRPIQGEIAGKYADIVVLTEEDDRETPGMEILNQIAEGAEKSGKKHDDNLFLILDRPKALKFALGKAKKGDMVLLLGKGNEKTIERADGAHEYSEEKTARTLLKELTKK
jgi:UDP-N-acetylmuramyl-tripeptide synthetase